MKDLTASEKSAEFKARKSTIVLIEEFMIGENLSGSLFGKTKAYEILEEIHNELTGQYEEFRGKYYIVKNCISGYLARVLNAVKYILGVPVDIQYVTGSEIKVRELIRLIQGWQEEIQQSISN